MSAQCVQWLEKLVAFDTTSRNSNLELIECIRAYLKDECGVERVVVQRSADGIHANLWATLPGDGGVTEGGIILSGHTDVVPVDGQKWDSDPFVLTERDGNLYGRGTCDMKGFIAVCMSLTPQFLKMKRAKPIHFAWTYNEETDFAGIRQLMADANIPTTKAEGCIIGEPTRFDLIVGHKGVQTAVVHLHGKAVHSSMSPFACNAIEHSASVVRFLRDLGREFRACGPFEEQYSLPHTTVCASMIQGGIAENTVPAECSITYEVRNIPSQPLGEVQRRIEEFVQATSLEMQKEDSSCGAEVCIKGAQEAFEGRSDTPIVAALRVANEELHQTVFAPYCTEATDYQMHGIDTVVWGPGGGTDHEPNEFMELEQLKKAERILVKAIACLTGALGPSQ